MDGPAPQTTIRIDGCDVVLLGTIPGYVPDADRVRAAIQDHQPDAIAVGIPPEDLEALAAIMDDPDVVADLEPDDLDQRFLELIGRFGDTHAIPSPDLEAIHDSGIPTVAVDMDDGHHTGRYTALVKVHHLVQRGAARKRLHKHAFDDAEDPYALARSWDATLLRVKPLATLESEREQHMADGIRALAARHGRLVAVVHAARFPGVFAHLTNGP